ncbi:MAG: hypothetical protein CMH61_01695 [Nanoarchaeota archaeon]|nr:hypothetical protein [Nanoarchaeota archaeon]|tara:strand:+ start:6816 stop:7922 length:1107 start_codon:yes stop_codon:yes gene_type:complete
MTNKKGLVLYWIVPVVIFALILFTVIVVRTTSLQTTVGGDWAFNFLDNVYDAEEELLVQDLLIKKSAWKTAVELSSSGGQVAESDCGTIDDINVWNKKEEWCLPDVSTNVLNKFVEHLEGNDKGYYDLDFTHGFSGKSDQKDVVSNDKGTYTYSYNFDVDLGYSFSGYDELFEKSQRFVFECRNVRDLKSCLEDKRGNWKFTSCENEAFRFGHVKIPFCARSSKLPEGFVDYSFALDFTPTTPFSLENVDAVQERDFLVVTVDKPTIIGDFTVYFIDSAYGRDLITSDSFDWNSVPSIVSHYKITMSASSLCPDFSQMVAGAGYTCSDKIHLAVSHSPGNYFVMVSNTRDGKESQFNAEIVETVLSTS